MIIECRPIGLLISTVAKGQWDNCILERSTALISGRHEDWYLGVCEN